MDTCDAVACRWFFSMYAVGMSTRISGVTAKISSVSELKYRKSRWFFDNVTKEVAIGDGVV